MSMLRPLDIVDNEILIALIVSPASSTDIAFTGKAPRSPRLKWLGYITF